MDNIILNMFGEFFKELRIKNGYTLRFYCRTFDRDPAYISRIERGRISPPQNKDDLKNLAHSLNLKDGTEEWNKFFDLAAISKGKIPEYIMTEKEIVKKLPLFLRTITDKEIDDNKLKELIELIKTA
jgi:transcriptional regulator with XRE-family HTH domain